jgi:hypothetical protein
MIFFVLNTSSLTFSVLTMTTIYLNGNKCFFLCEVNNYLLEKLKQYLSLDGEKFLDTRGYLVTHALVCRSGTQTHFEAFGCPPELWHTPANHDLYYEFYDLFGSAIIAVHNGNYSPTGDEIVIDVPYCNQQ